MAPGRKQARKLATFESKIMDLFVENNQYLRENNAILQEMDRVLKDMDDKLRKITLNWSYR